jgi:glycosyltransferase involved in cell wall biosynthesis
VAAVIGVVIPARNEERSVGEVVRATRAALPGTVVVVVDDASDDATALTASDAGARVITLERRVGYAQALRLGYQAVLDDGAGEVVQLDADGQHAPHDAKALLAGLDRFDVVVGSRFLGPTYRMSPGRRAGITACRLMARLGGLDLTDPTSGFRAMRRPVAEAIARDGFPDGLTESSFLVRLHREGVSIGEIPVRMSPPANGSMHDGVAGVKHFLRISRATMAIALKRMPR